jgi:hypothetical protein
MIWAPMVKNGCSEVLEDHRGLGAAHRPQLLLGHADDLAPADLDRAGHPGAGPVVQAHHGHARHALAGAGLAHDGQGAAQR